MKVQVKNAIFFVTKKVIKKQTGSNWNFLQPPIPVYRDTYIPYSKSIPPFSIACLFWKLSQCSGQNQQNGKHTVNYHPSPSQLISRIHPLIFLWTPKGFISPESFLIFFLNLYIPLWLWKSFKFILLRLLVNTFVNQKIESVHFYSCPQATLPQVFISTSQAEGNYSFLLNRVFWRSIFSPAESGGGEDYGSEKISKIKPTKVLFTNFDKFHHLCIIDFCFVVP